MEFKRRRHNHVHLNITPLVDVVFLLLLFFMLTSHFIHEPAIKVNLPESKTADMKDRSVKTVMITKNGEIYFMNKRVDLENLRVFIKENLQDVEKDSLRIKADTDADVGLLVRVIDEIRLAGVKNFSIVTEKK